MKFEIKHRGNGEILFSIETDSWKLAIEAAIKAKANLSEADLSVIRCDFLELILHAIPEIAGLKKALLDGKVDGSTYQGECACLVGTIANVKGCDYNGLAGIKPNNGRPAERFFLGIKIGDTPENNPCSKLAVQWIDELEEILKAEFNRGRTEQMETLKP